jgi:hypothetical protein
MYHLNKKVKLDLDINDIDNIINYNFEKNNYDIIIKYYNNINNINNESFTNNILFIICLSNIKLEKYHDALNILNNIQNNIQINNSNNIFTLNFYKKFDIIDDRFRLFQEINSINSFALLTNCLLGFCYKKINDIEKSIQYFENANNLAKENILINLSISISSNLIELYETDKVIYFDKLINLYKFKNEHTKIIELYETKNMNKEINTYIQNILHDEYIFMLDNNNIEYYLDKYSIIDDSDILFLLEKYTNLNKSDNIKNLFNISLEKNYCSEIKIKILFELVKRNNKKIKYCELIFNEIENLKDKSNDINNIIKNVISYYNNELYYNGILGKDKYKKYLEKKNLDIINNNLCKYLNLYKYFDISNIKTDNCVICLNNNVIITLNCHFSHIVCYKCYSKIDKCPMCRDIIYK